MTFFRILVSGTLLLSAVTGAAQTNAPARQAAPANSDFGSKFFDDLRMLFGRLEQSELDRAFQRASAVHCGDLVGQNGDWKEVAFLNDDRNLGNWHYDKIDDVRRDPTKLVFSGLCRGDRGPVRVATSYPISDTQGRSLRLRDNDAVSVIFDPPTDSYTFQLPYLYLTGQDSQGSIYTLFPPTLSSRPAKDVAEEFRCKALSDPELTYRFLLCRTHVVEIDPQLQRLNRSKQPLGNAAYYILSDGKEAGSTVKLTYGPDVESSKVETTSQPNALPARQPLPEWQHPPEVWHAASADSRLVQIGEGEFRLRFNSQAWNGRLRTAQSLAAKAFLASSRTASSRADYCVWRPGNSPEIDSLLDTATPGALLYSLSFSKELQAGMSAVFDIDNPEGTRLGSLQCYFPQSQTPADLTVARWLSVIGTTVALEVRNP